MSEREQDNNADRSHEPTQQKLRRAREKGDVPYSVEATAAATYIGFFVALLVAVGWCATKLQGTLTALLHKPDMISKEVLRMPTLQETYTTDLLLQGN